MNINISVSDNVNALLSLDKQIVFAAAKSLTQVAKESQKAVIDGIQGDFTIRSDWYLPSRKYGIRIKTATKQDLSAEVKSSADWLAAQELGQTHTPRGGRQEIAVPTSAIQPTGREVIRRPLRPRGSKNRKAFIITSHRGNRLLVKRVGPRPQDIIVLYVLERSAPRKKKTPMTTAVKRTVEQRFGSIFNRNLKDAIATAK